MGRDQRALSQTHVLGHLLRRGWWLACLDTCWDWVRDGPWPREQHTSSPVTPRRHTPMGKVFTFLHLSSICLLLSLHQELDRFIHVGNILYAELGKEDNRG